MTDIPTITQEEAVEVRAGLAAIVVRHTKIGGYPDTHAIAADAFELGRALSPNMDHAVGGVREKRAMAEIKGHADMANEVIRLGRASTGGGRVKVATCLHHIARIARDVLSAPQTLASTPPVNQDAVREAKAWDWLFLKADLGQYAPNDRDYSAGEMVNAFIAGAEAALATPPLDNTGLDAATVERPDGAIENLTNFQQQADMHGEFVKVSRQALDETLAYVAALASGDRS